METGKAIYYLLKDSTAVGNICADRIYPEIAQQDADVPFIAYTITDTTPSGTKSGSSDLDTARVELFIVSDDYAEAMDLGIAVRAALDRQGGDIGPAGSTVAVQSIDFDTSDVDFDQEQGVYITEHTYNMRIQRTGQAGSITVTPNNAINVSDNDSSGAVTNIVFSDNTVDIVGNTATVASGGGGGTLTVQETGDTNSDTADTIEFPEGSVTHDSNDKATISVLAGLITEYGADAGLTDNMFPNGLFGDIDQNGTVSTQDLLAVLGNFGATASPGTNQVARELERAAAQISDGNGSTFNHLRDKDAADTVTALEGQGHDVEFFEGVNTALGRGFKSQYGSDTVADATVRRTLYISATPFPSSLAQMQVYPLGPYDNQSETLVQTVVDAYLEGLNGNGSIVVIREEVSSTPDKLLDTYTGAAAAYSVRKLDKDYTGNCMRIRRDSDDAETDIGFDSSGDLDTAAIASHCGSASGYVVTWYDQSGNSNNATQSTTGKQPQIYNGTAVITENGKPAIENVLTGQQGLNIGSFTINLSDFTCCLVSKFYSDSSQEGKAIFINGDVQASQDYRYKQFGITRNRFYLGTSTQQSFFNKVTYTSSNSQQLHTITPTNGYVDGTSQGTFGVSGEDLDLTPSKNYVASGDIGRDRGTHARTSEMIIWTADQSSNRTGIETDINDYYSIY